MKINIVSTDTNADELVAAVLRVVQLAASSAGQQQEPAPPQPSEQRKLAYSIDEAVEVLSIGRTHLFDLLHRGEITSVKIGRRRLIPAGTLEGYLARLIAEQAGETPWSSRRTAH